MTLNGSKFRALRRLSNAANETLANVGETCERVPVVSLATLWASGKIAPILDDAPRERSDDDARGE